MLFIWNMSTYTTYNTTHSGLEENMITLTLPWSNASDPPFMWAQNISSTEESVTHTPLYYHIPKFNVPSLVVICVLLSLLILCTIIGNVFVISAIILERSLHGVSNYLILSLAVTDLLVAILVMPISLVNEISQNWYLGHQVCDMWISMDVLCCTASILHLVAISLDRYWGVSNIDYIRRRCSKQIILMVIVVWIVSVSISIPPLFGWKDEKNNPERTGQCIISQDWGYTIFSTVGAFYFPMILMIILNLKIYMAAKSRIRKKSFSTGPPSGPSMYANTDMKTNGNGSSGSEISQDGFTVYNASMAISCNMNGESVFHVSDQHSSQTGRRHSYLTVPSNVYTVCRHGNGAKRHDNNNHKKFRHRDQEKKRKEKLEMKRERKAAKVLGIITGAFIACWLPFFIIAITAPFCGSNCHFPDAIYSVTLWLGYINSSLNPVIYTIFNPSFRKSFQKIIYGRYRRRR
ncbi:hypothetical protein ACJMK2_023298 [Sinanodonta woodiana]|uniref:G-protein coupled receptors family 1 profile domain-containing protein n=1 Tax=Sinanodonta woodiana TaxID=1069815 RepID=A0ABD3T3R9_SINWO